jgi:hypothetical protein
MTAIRARLRRPPDPEELAHARWEGRRDERTRILDAVAAMPRVGKTAIGEIIAAGIDADRGWARRDFIAKNGYDPEGSD